MVNITNGSQLMRVPNSMFENVYKHRGFRKVKEKAVKEQAVTEPTPFDGFTPEQQETLKAFVATPYGQWAGDKAQDVVRILDAVEQFTELKKFNEEVKPALKKLLEERGLLK